MCIHYSTSSHPRRAFGTTLTHDLSAFQENARGRFLKVSETFTRGYSRFQIFIPADGMEEFNLHLKELIEEYDDGEIEEAAAAPENRHVRIENKNFFFSCKKNQQGR